MKKKLVLAFYLEKSGEAIYHQAYHSLGKVGNMNLTASHLVVQLGPGMELGTDMGRGRRGHSCEMTFVEQKGGTAASHPYCPGGILRCIEERYAGSLQLLFPVYQSHQKHGI